MIRVRLYCEGFHKVWCHGSSLVFVKVSESS